MFMFSFVVLTLRCVVPCDVFSFASARGRLKEELAHSIARTLIFDSFTHIKSMLHILPLVS
jgi:hypothetical protein